MSNINYKTSDYTVGSFLPDANSDFKETVQSVFESFRNNENLDPMEDILKILKVDALRESYKEELLSDVRDQQFEDPYMAQTYDKLDQLFENTQLEMVRENTGTLNPIVGFTLPILKKSYLECHGKDIVMTEVAPSPIVKMAFERKFLKDKEGNKYYIPEIYYDDKFQEVMPHALGKQVTSKFYPEAGLFPIHEFNVLEASGGSIALRDSLSANFVIDAVIIDVNGVDVTLEGLGIRPDKGTQGTFGYKVVAKNPAGDIAEDFISGRLDYYTGKITVSHSNGLIKQVRFAGNLSNQHNTESLEFDREREPITWEIPEGARFNTGMTIERLRDTQALTNIDLMAETISDMSETMSQYEDSTILAFLEQSFNTWKERKTLPFGFEDGFTETYQFDFIPPTNTILPTSQWSHDIKWYLNRQMDSLKEKLKTDKIMFVIYGNPAHISLLQDDVKWVIDDSSRVGGVQLEYRFGVMTKTKSRVHVVSTMKVSRDKGLRIVAFPTTKEHITFKHLKYSINISNEYRNPLTPLVPNIMGTSRFLTTEVLPVQGEMKLKNSDFGRVI